MNRDNGEHMRNLDPIRDPLKIEKTAEIERTAMKKKTDLLVVGVYAALIILGIGTGYLLTRSSSAANTMGGTSASAPASGGKIYGSNDLKTFNDSAVGTLEKGGIAGEGTHKLVREGGPSQTACLVSSVLDLDQFVGKKVKVNGKTMEAKTCPWFMDAGRIELQ